MTTKSETPLLAYLEEDNVTQECKYLMSSLPREQVWLGKYLYQYQGFWHPSTQLQGVLNSQKRFEAKDGDIILVTSPKSGTTWLKALLFALMNRQTLQDSKEQHPIFTNSPHLLVPFLEIGLYYNTHNPDLSGISSPRLFGTHLPLVSLPVSIKDSPCKIVYCCRNPKDTFVSLWHFMNKLRPKDMGNCLLIEDEFDKFCRGVSAYGPFWDHALAYWKESQKNPGRVLFLKYEELKEQPAVQLKRLARFVDCPFSEEEEIKGKIDDILKLCSLDTLSNLEANKNGKILPIEADVSYFFRKGEKGVWRDTLTASMAEEIDRITEEKFHGSGLKFDS